MNTVIGMSGMTSQFGSGLSSSLLPPSSPSVSCTQCRPLKLLALSLFLSLSRVLPVSHPPSSRSLSPLRVFSCDLALSRSSGKCDWRAGESVVVGLQAP